MGKSMPFYTPGGSEQSKPPTAPFSSSKVKHSLHRLLRSDRRHAAIIIADPSDAPHAGETRPDDDLPGAERGEHALVGRSEESNCRHLLGRSEVHGAGIAGGQHITATEKRGKQQQGRLPGQRLYRHG